MYTRLLDSLVCWYGRSMEFGVYRYLMAATVLALGMLFNAVSLLAIASMLGPVNLMKTPGISAIPVCLGVIFWLVNSALACRRFQRGAGLSTDQARSASPRLGVLYFGASFLVLISSFALLILIKG
jgi:hypothetical protein